MITRFHPLLSMLVMSLALTAASSAQTDDGGDTTARPGSRLAVIDLHFPGGSALEFVQAVQKISPGANVVVLSEISKIHVPAMDLKRVTVRAAIELLADMTDDDRSPTLYLEVDRTQSRAVGASDVHTIRAIPRIYKGSTERQTMVLAVGDLLEGSLEAADLITAIETTLDQLSNEHAPADVKFHEATGLLITRGHPEQTDAIRQVVRQLNDAAELRTARALRQQNIEEMIARNEALEERSAVLQATFEESRRENAELVQQLRAMELNLGRYEMEIERMRSRVNDLEVELERARGDGG